MAASNALSHISSRAMKRAEKELSQTKVIIRRLPPDFTEEKFRETVDPLPPNNFFYFFPGDQSLGKFGCARAYINFTADGDIVLFRDKYDGMILESQKGMKYRAVIEYAPFQCVPRRNRKPDARCGTIEQEAEYQEFLESYEKGTAPLPSIDLSYLEQLEANRVPRIIMTPLVEFIKEKRAPKPKKNKVIYAQDTKRKREKERKTGEGRGISRSKLTEKIRGGHLTRKSDKERSKKDSSIKPQSDDRITMEMNGTREVDRKQSALPNSSFHLARKNEAKPIQASADEQTRQDGEGSSSSRSARDKTPRTKGRPDQQIYNPRAAKRWHVDSKEKEPSSASSKKELSWPAGSKEHSPKDGQGEKAKSKSGVSSGHRYMDRYGSSRDYQFRDQYDDDYRGPGGRRGQGRRDHDYSYDQHYWDNGRGGGFEYEDRRKGREKSSVDGQYRRGREYSRGETRYYPAGGSGSHSKSSRSSYK